MNHIDPRLRERFLSGMSYAACTVNVVTTDGPGGRAGVTVSAMSSVSADMPQPTLLVCVHHLSPAARAILANGVFCVNILRDDQSYISDSFAGRYKTADGDKFSCAAWTTERTGSPRVVDPLVAFDCRLINSQQVGTHHVLLGAVEHVFAAGSGSPLIYANRAYGTALRVDNYRTPEPSSAETLKVGAFHTFGPYLLPEVLERLARAGRVGDVRLREGDQRQIMEALRSGEIEIALLYDFDLGDDVVLERLGSVEPYVLLPEGHPLAELKTIPAADLIGEPLILLDAPPSGDYFLSIFQQQDLVPKIGLRTRSFEMVRGMVGHGLGYSLLATKPASNMTYDGRALVTRPLEGEAPVSHVAIVRRPQTELSDVAQAFVEECRDFFRVAASPDPGRDRNQGGQGRPVGDPETELRRA
jgi:flavin reductase (DIM6/NTAB) family NADH-FMN oxidoreductase RutF